jgi:hypothetical protein
MNGEAKPTIEWIDGDPPPKSTGVGRSNSHTTMLIIGALMTQPGRWALVARRPLTSMSITFRRYHCEYVERTIAGSTCVYARFTGKDS